MPSPASALPPLVVAACGLAAAGLVGCDKDNTPVPAAAAYRSSAGRGASTEVAATDDPAALKVTVDDSGRKWLNGKIPYDVFPDVPSDEEVAAGGAGIERSPVASDKSATIVASTDRTGPTPSPEALDEPTAPRSATPEAPPSDGTAVGGWDQILPVESLQREIAAVRNDLSEKLLTVGNYNESFETVANDGWLMSALATIAQEHPASISWKGNALLARDAATALAMAATAKGRKNFGDAQLANEHVAALLDNNTPPGLPTPDPAASREETADRAGLMTRMQAAFDRLKEAGADEAALKKNLDAAAHEARVLAALAKFTAHVDYGSADEADYQAASGEVTSAGGAMAEAAAAEDYAGFKSGFDRVGTACNKCHEKYRFAN